MVTEDALRDDLKKAMLSKDRTRTRVLRAILAAAKNATIEKKVAELGETDMLSVVKREVKQRNESMEFARQAGRAETVVELEEEIAVLEAYLPKQLGEAELTDAIRAIVESGGISTIGPIMKELSARYPGQYDGKLASHIAQQVIAK